MVQLAQINIATMVAPSDDPRVSEFMDNLEAINALAERSPGFVWRLQTDSGNATDIQLFDDPRRLINVSVWESVETLREYVYRSEHRAFLHRRREWFVPGSTSVALWWIADGTVPALDDAVARAAFLDRRGASAYAFGFAHRNPALVFEQTRPDDPQTAALIKRLNVELRSVATSPEENHFGLEPEEVLGTRGRMLRARLDDRLVGCGAVRRIEPTVGELKRMYVDPSRRGEAIGAALLDQLEIEARRLGLAEMRLETGVHQPAAIGLYEGAGYSPIAPWGEYLTTPETSLCYARSL